MLPMHKRTAAQSWDASQNTDSNQPEAKSVPGSHKAAQLAANLHLQETEILNYNHPSLQELISERGWKELPEYDRIGVIYDFVRNEIEFGYNSEDDIPASQVLAEGYGQCNTKGTLLMALLRGVGISCRFHGFTITKELQKGAITGLWYRLAPQEIIHSWVEVWRDGWINLEGFIIDDRFLKSVQKRFASSDGTFCGFGIATKNLQNPGVEWNGSDTYIQKEGIHRDLGIYDHPDQFYREHGSNLSGIKKALYSRFIRHRINANVRRLRANGGTN